MNLAFVALGVCATALGVGRLSRLRDDPATLTQKAIIVSLLSTGVGALAYGTRLATAPLYDIGGDRKSTRLNSSHVAISYAVFCLKKKKKTNKYTEHDEDVHNTPTDHSNEE